MNAKVEAIRFKNIEGKESLYITITNELGNERMNIQVGETNFKKAEKMFKKEEDKKNDNQKIK